MNEENSKVNTEELKKEASNTFNEVKSQVKESFKKDELKNSAKETSNFVGGMFKDPLGTIKSTAEDSTNKNFKFAVILVVVWLIAGALHGMRATSSYLSVGTNMLRIIKYTLAPLCSVLALAVILMVLNKKEKKSLVSLISVAVASFLPVIVSDVASLLLFISSDVSKVTTPFAKLCSVVSAVLVYFGVKYVMDEKEDSKCIVKFAMVEACYYVVYIVLGLLGIYI